MASGGEGSRNLNKGNGPLQDLLEHQDYLKKTWSVSSMVKSEFEGMNNTMELLEKMNLKVEEEYIGFGDLASVLRVFVEQLMSKSGSFNDYVQ
ncbi:hypothetical protein Dsin_013130 [Dipteronia sinensis]|uniref:Uncharacterized protein n=1 Tax=Dipteronia sinensis TaxID=43782 RepID=A0AAE0EAA3_9ROSI|nr:hypothetical protein Dsin_013130 [Dipteronia sinensis]